MSEKHQVVVGIYIYNYIYYMMPRSTPRVVFLSLPMAGSDLCLVLLCYLWPRLVANQAVLQPHKRAFSTVRPGEFSPGSRPLFLGFKTKTPAIKTARVLAGCRLKVHICPCLPNIILCKQDANIACKAGMLRGMLLYAAIFLA